MNPISRVIQVSSNFDDERKVPDNQSSANECNNENAEIFNRVMQSGHENLALNTKESIEEAISDYISADEVNPNPETKSFLIQAYLAIGDFINARHIYGELKEQIEDSNDPSSKFLFESKFYFVKAFLKNYYLNKACYLLKHISNDKSDKDQSLNVYVFSNLTYYYFEISNSKLKNTEQFINDAKIYFNKLFAIAPKHENTLILHAKIFKKINAK